MKTADITILGDPVDPGALTQIERCAQTADKAALMADHHKGYGVPIGGVVAYRNHVSPTGVGFDIACGNAAVRLDAPGEDVRRDIRRIMDEVWKVISFGVGRKNNEPVDDPVFSSDRWKIPAAFSLKRLAEQQLGTVGSGNHYVDVFIDELARPWVGVHFGSRGLGHKLASHFLAAAGAKDGMDVDPCLLPTDMPLGQDYLECMHLASDYAYAGRRWVCDRVARIIGAPVVEVVHNNHNLAWRERHEGEDYWVIRKGATPAFPGQKGFIGATMCEPAVIVEGVDSPLSQKLLYSTVHGAGRIMGRREAAGKTHRRTGEVVRPGRVTPAMMGEWVKTAGIELRGGGLDESPNCYKRLPGVLSAHGPTITILNTLTPIGVAMAAPGDFDPYKD